MALRPGDRLSAWVLDREIEVPVRRRPWRVHHAETGARGVLKYEVPIDGERAAPPADLRFLRRVAPPLARAFHITPRLDDGIDEGIAWLVVEDAGDRDLRSELAGRRLEPDAALDLLVQIGLSLACMAHFGAVHRDVKEENIVVAGEAGARRFMLTDFGIAVPLDGRDRVTADGAGTVARMSPEQVAGSGIGPASDVYQLCTTVAAVLSGQDAPRFGTDADPGAVAWRLDLDPTDRANRILAALLAWGRTTDQGLRPTAVEVVGVALALKRGDLDEAEAGLAVSRRPRIAAPEPAAGPSLAAGIPESTPHETGRRGRPARWAVGLTGLASALAFAFVLRPERFGTQADRATPATAGAAGQPAGPFLKFEDASLAWRIGAALPGALPRPPSGRTTSGFLYPPTLVHPFDDDRLRILLPRAVRKGHVRVPGLERSLLGQIGDEGTFWEEAPLPPTDPLRWAEVVDLDGDGARDLLLAQDDPDYHVVHTAVFGPAPWRADPKRYPARVPGYPFVLPPDARGLTTVLTYGPTGFQLASDGSRFRRGDAPGFTGSPHEWLDLDGDGTFEVLANDAQGLALARRGPDGWRAEPVLDLAAGRAPWQTRGANVAVADVDGDGDEDAVVMPRLERGLVALRNDGGRLVPREIEGVLLQAPDNGQLDFLNAVTLADLDGDGLPEILHPSGSFEANGAQPASIWRNLGGFRFESVPLPERLARPHQGSRFLVVDVDRDGRPDLLDLSPNDADLLEPTHRAFRNVSTGPGRLRPLVVRLDDRAPLPLGTRIESMVGRPWVRVVRDDGPLYVPEWLGGPLLVTLPDGRIGVAGAPAGGTPPGAWSRVTFAPLPPMYAAGGALIERGLPADGGPGTRFHAVRGVWDVTLTADTTGATLTVRTPGTPPWTRRAPDIEVGLGCPDADRCLFVEQQADGAFRPLEVDLAGRSARVLDGTASWSKVGVAFDGRAFDVDGYRLVARDPRTYHRPGPARELPGHPCVDLAGAGDRLGCCMVSPPRFSEIDAETLEVRWIRPIEAKESCSVVDASGRWLVADDRRVSLVTVAGANEVARLGEPVRLVRAGESVLAVGSHRVLRIDATAGSIVGGTLVPRVGRALAVPEGGQLGRH